jgi:hypothetical protein
MIINSRKLMPMDFAALAAGSSAHAAITIVGTPTRGFLGSNKSQVTTAHNGSTEVSFDASGTDKLVVAIGSESGFGGNSVTNMSLSFNGEAMTRAVFANDRSAAGDSGGLAIFYLDNPFQGASTFTFGFTATGGGANGGIASIYGLAGTVDGVGNTGKSSLTQASAGNVSTSITTSGADSWVFAAVQNSGTNNSAGTPSIVAPLTAGHSGFWGTQWGGLASGTQTVSTSGSSLTPTFSTNAGNNIQVAAVEFLAVPEPSSALLGGLGVLALLRRRR